MAQLTCCLAVMLFVGAPLLADQYWIAYEGNELPENVGWTRYWGNWQGPKKGEAKRTLKDGIITYDTLHDPGVYDFAEIKRPGQIDPDPGEMFVMEWRLRAEVVVGEFAPNSGMCSDTGKAISFRVGIDRVTSGFDPTLNVPITPGVFHAYRMESADMVRYAFYVDRVLAHRGTFWQGVGKSRVYWGEGVQGYAGLHHWDYFRFGVIPEPAIALMLLVAVTGRGLLRR